MRLYHYLIKAVQEYLDDACPKKMSDEEIMETLYYVKNLRNCMTDEIDLHVADYLMSSLLKEGRSRGGLVFCNFPPSGEVNFNSNSLLEIFEAIPRKGRMKLIEGAFKTAKKRGIIAQECKLRPF